MLVHVDPLASISSALTAVQSARAATQGIGSRHRASAQHRNAVQHQFQAVATKTIVTAEYFAVLARAALREQRDIFAAAALSGLVEFRSDADGIARALRPLTRTAFGSAAAAELVRLNAARADVRELFTTLDLLVSASQAVADASARPVQAAAENVLLSISDLYTRLPAPVSPLRAIATAWRAAGVRDSDYQEALAEAWARHRAFREIANARPGWAQRARAVLRRNS